MRHSKYTKYFKDVAINHGSILHDPKAKKENFFRVWDNEDLGPEMYLDELLAAALNKITRERPFMVLESYVKDVDDNKTGSPKGVMGGAFYILHSPKKDDHDDEQVKIDECEEIAEDIMAFAALDFPDTCGCLMLDDYHIHTMAKAGNGSYFGVKCYFRFQATSDSMYYRAERWVKPLAL